MVIYNSTLFLGLNLIIECVSKYFIRQEKKKNYNHLFTHLKDTNPAGLPFLETSYDVEEI